ncbi:MAG: ComF family protein [Prevotella sp.]|jgi:ComF family protein|nr:ComF family protein [Prevotella sp.]
MKDSFWSRLVDLIAPRACVVCGGRLGIHEFFLCGSCNLQLPRTNYADNPYENDMARLFWGQLPVERCAALFFYQGGSGPSQILYELKYKNHPEIGEFFGRMIAEEWNDTGFFEGIDLIVPVPLAKERQRQRGYNQSLHIARGIGSVTRLPIVTNAVSREQFVESQTQKDRWQRNENVEGCFRLNDGSALKGRHVLLVDDVVTTGATICSCGREMLKAGDVRFSILTIGFAKSK